MSQVQEIEYVAATQTLIGQKRRTLVDNDTGEKIEVDEITKRAYGQAQFWKCYLMDFLTILGILDSKQVDVLIYICENTKQDSNLFIGTYKKIKKDVGVSEPTIAKIMKKLQENSFIKKVSNGVWLVNPEILMKGGEQKKQVLLSYFNSADPADEISKSKTKKENTFKTSTPTQYCFKGIDMKVKVEDE